MKKIIFENCSTQYLGFPICFFDTTGVSSVNMKLHLQERQMILNELLPPRIAEDYEVLYKLNKFKHTRLYNRLFKYFFKL